MGILNINLNNVGLNNKLEEDYPDTIILMRPLAQLIKFRKRKELKIELSDELMPVAWHPDRWWDRCKSEEIDPMFIEEL